MIDRLVSRPTRSSSSSGPIGKLQPPFIAASMSSRVATPASKSLTALLSYGKSNAFTMKPAWSRTRTAFLPYAVSLTGVELVELNLLRERLLQAGHQLVGGALRAAAQHDLHACLGRDLGDPRAHDSRADDADALHRHLPLLLERPKVVRVAARLPNEPSARDR